MSPVAPESWAASEKLPPTFQTLRSPDSDPAATNPLSGETAR